jgi:hypothetical protein
MLSIQHFHDELYNTSEELKLEERVIQALVNTSCHFNIFYFLLYMSFSILYQSNFHIFQNKIMQLKI